MYFEIENTPEHIRRARRAETMQKTSPKEECPRLILAPFSRPPQVVFEDVLIGTSCERNLEIYNPSKQMQQITLGRSLPPGLVIHLPEEWLLLEPETCYSLTMIWTPLQPTALRETIRFTNENRGRYDVIVVLKSTMIIKGKSNQTKGFKISPGKVKKKSAKKSPVSIYKKKADVIYNTMQNKKSINVIQSTTQNTVLKLSNKENVSNINDHTIETHSNKCPFDSPTSFDFNFNTSELFSNMRRPKTGEILQKTYDKSYNIPSDNKESVSTQQNVLKPSNKQLLDTSATDIFDNLTFTPLKSLPTKNENLKKGPKIVLSINSESDYDDSLDTSKENETHSIISVTSSQPPNKWLTVTRHSRLESQYTETPIIQDKKIPNTSSPKEMNTPNFSINTEFSRISDSSFFPQRFSTEKKILPKINNVTHEIIDDVNYHNQLSSDTYTKESPKSPMELDINLMNVEKESKVCRQALFKEYHQQKDIFDKNNCERNIWQNDLRANIIKSPPRSLTPPLQSIPEESTQLSDTHLFDNTNKQMATFTINRTFDKVHDRASLSTSTRQTWSKKAVRAEPDLWKIPISYIKNTLKSRTSMKGKDSIGSKISNITFEGNKSVSQNVSLNQLGNVYSQSLTVDPFLSSTYFYDEEAVDKFETEFKRWLNYILTPPAELDSNVEQKIDVGKAWIENRNKEIPAAPTKEQVSNLYHNNHRLESLHRSARTLLMSSEIAQVFQKLNAQIEKKLIVIRTDRNLHLDVGLQKIIMELLLSYNPLWLRIGLEAIYGLVIPLKSNNDIEGLTIFIIQRMFKNPHLKNKHSKSSAPNMLLPAYMEAIKKFTLKKFFMLVFFLDQAKQRKIISHDPCLFCRNAVCKESREIIIRFTRELIAGIGDITKHLRPLGYVVSHKQSYLDEYKYAVHNIALDIRDGVRLTKVMEIILMKNGLLKQLRTPAISRLQKIHNVQVALNALKEANFVIIGDISANDIADGHREKTLSLLWQLIHVFRAPLFEKAANVIQTWWKKKYEVIINKRKEEEKIRKELNNAANVIQCWWRRIQCRREIIWKIQQITSATIVLQKYCRMWLCRNRLRKSKESVINIEEWYKGVKMIKEAKETLAKLRLERDNLRCKSATVIQSYIRRWLCMRQYKTNFKRIVLIQSLVRSFLIKKWYLRLKNSITFIQLRYKSKLLMRTEMKKLAEKRKSAIIIQSYFRMLKQYRLFQKLKKAVKVFEDRYIALVKMRIERKKYLEVQRRVIAIQALYRGQMCRIEYMKQRNIILNLQRKVRALQLMKKEKTHFLQMKQATLVLQRYIRSYQAMKKAKYVYNTQRKSAVCIQQYFRSYLLTKTQRNSYIQLRNATTVIQKYYRSLKITRQKRSEFLKLKYYTVLIQRQFRVQILMRELKGNYKKLRAAVIVTQRRFRAQIKMRGERSKYIKMRNSCQIIQNAYRAYVLGKQQRQIFLKQKNAAEIIQNWFRCCKKGKEIKQEFQQSKQACVTIQRIYRAYIIGKKQRKEYLRIKTATIYIQKYYRSYIEMKTVREQYIQMKASTVTIQKFYRSHIETKKQRDAYLKIKAATLLIQNYYRSYKETKKIRQEYCELRKATLLIQNRYRALHAMRIEKSKYLKLKHSVIVVQQKYKALLAMRKERQAYQTLLSAVLITQRKFRAQMLMKRDRMRYNIILKACVAIQICYRAYITRKKQQDYYNKLKFSTVTLQRRYRALLEMRKDRNSYLITRSAVITIQRRFRAHYFMLQNRSQFTKILKACITIQRAYRAYLLGKNQRNEYVTLKSSVIMIQRRFRLSMEARKIRNRYLHLINAVLFTQRRFRAIIVAREIRRNKAAKTIQTWYRSIIKRNECRNKFLQLRKSAIMIQSIFRMYILRKEFIVKKASVVCIQRYYRSYRLRINDKQKYIKLRTSIIKLQSYVRSYIQRKKYLNIRSAALKIQIAYRFKRQRDLLNKQREAAAICLQKNIKRYLVQSRYQEYRKRIVFVQQIWRGKLITRLLHYDFLQKRNFIVKLQAVIRGYLVRKEIQYKKEILQKVKEEKRHHWAASKIQALFRGDRVRTNFAADKRVAELRRRWREGALASTQESLKERNEEAMEVLCNMSDIETVIRAFRSLELLTEVFPMMYNNNASSIVRRVYIYMSVTNRSISSIEVLKSAASVLVNLTRYKTTGPKIYARDRIPPILKFMWRFSNSEIQLFCILSTYIWLFSKYEDVKEDLKKFLHIPGNLKILSTIKSNVDRMKRMASNSVKNKFHTPQTSKFISHTFNQSLRDNSTNHSICSSNSNSSFLLPALEPDYGISRPDKPRYFEDAQQAINCLFNTYDL